MKVDVTHGLAPVSAAVGDDTKAVLCQSGALGHSLCGEKNLSDQAAILWTKAHQSGDVLSRNDQLVNRRLGVEVLNRNQCLTLVGEGGRDLPPNDPAKDALFHSDPIAFRLAPTSA
jgi:hypothetical protein